MAAADTTELRRLDKDTLVEGFQRMAGRARRYKEKAKVAAENAMEIAMAGGTAFGVGYYMGTIEKDGGAAEDLQWFGMDIDLVVGLGLAGVGLTGMAGKKMSGAARAAGMGALSLWAGNYGREMARTAE